jgi:tRNA(Ile)-lysidine synthase
MRGILPVRERIIRPLLCLERKDIEDYLARQGQGWCTDATNAALVYSRNKIRHQVLPALTEVNPQAVAHLGQAASDMAEVWAVVARQAAVARERWVDGWLIRDGLLQELPLIQRTLVQELLGELAGTRKDLGRVHVEQVLGLYSHQVGHTLCLPYGLTACRTYEGIRLEGPGTVEEARKISDKMLVPGQELLIPQLGISITSRVLEFNENLKEIPQKAYTKWFDYDKIKDGLLVRNRRTGDYLTVDAKGSRQSLKKYLINQKVPKQLREELILVADGAHILWVVGYRMSAAYRVTEDTRHILEIQIHGGTIHE